MNTSRCCCNYEPPTLRCAECQRGQHTMCSEQPVRLTDRANPGIPEKRTPGRCKWYARDHRFYPARMVAASSANVGEIVEVVVEPCPAGEATVYACSRCRHIWPAVDVERATRTEA